ncbi:MAG: SRPBCC family protein [Mycobacteriales bacterium]
MGEVEVSVQVAAEPARVWELVGDPARMGQWSPECYRVDWIDGASGPAVGARFHGHNRLGWRKWTTTGQIVTYESGRALAFDVSLFGRPVARWSYLVEPDGSQTRLTEKFLDRRDKIFRLLGPAARGVSDTEKHNRAGMLATLERIRLAAEGG